MSWKEDKEGNVSTLESVRNYISELKDLPEGEAFPNPIMKDTGIWSLICREMDVWEWKGRDC